MIQAVRRLTTGTALFVILVFTSATHAQRDYGVDVSSFNRTINWTTVAKPKAQGGGGITFAFVRATRGGLTSAESRVDDTSFITNITGAKSAGLYVAPYHFSRADLYNPATPNGPNSPESEADHFIAVAGTYMTAGYMRPVLDLESGSQLTRTQLTDWALRFCARIQAVKGANIRPIIYCSSSYANDEVDNRLAAYSLWLARPDQAGQNTDTGDPVPAGVYPNAYGVWRTDPINDPHPWAFWQYSWTGVVPGIQGVNAAGHTDLNVVQSERMSIQQFLIGNVVPEPTFAILLLAPALLLTRPSLTYRT